MGILVQKDEEQTELSTRISAELRERNSRSSKQEDVDLVDDSAYLAGTKRSGGATIFWITAVVVMILSVIVIFSVR